MKTVDARGQKCPVPLIMTKKALAEIGADEVLEILIDNETSVKNVTRFLEEHMMMVGTEQEGDIFRLVVHKTGVIPEQTRVEEYCEIPQQPNTDYVVAFQKFDYTKGPDELDTMLMKAFVGTLPDLDYRPRAMVFLSTGIYLALNDSPVLESLIRLEKEGVKILVCGTCLDFFGKKPELGAGIVSNMYDILNLMTTAGKVIYA